MVLGTNRVTFQGVSQKGLVTFLQAVETAVNELITDHATRITWGTEVDSDLDVINNLLDLLGQDGLLEGVPGVQEGTSDTTKLKLAGTNLRYQIGGKQYFSAGVLETEPPTGEITVSTWGAYRMELDISGALTVTRKADPMAYANKEDAILSIASVARTANSIDVGYLAIDAGGSGFTAQTDLPVIGDANVDTIEWTDVIVSRAQNGLNAAVTVAVADGVATLNISAVNADANGVKLAQISAASTQAMDDADTVDTAKWGGWLLIVDHAGSGTYALAADGVAGTVSVMAYANKAAVDTALDLVQDRLPAHCVPIARVYLNNVGGGNAWVAATDDWDHDTAVATVEVYPVTHDRASDKTRSAIRPTIPDSVTAPVVATLTASAVDLE